jgi:hypothetical protein
MLFTSVSLPQSDTTFLMYNFFYSLFSEHINTASVECTSSPPNRTFSVLNAIASNFQFVDAELNQPLNFLKYNYTI